MDEEEVTRTVVRKLLASHTAMWGVQEWSLTVPGVAVSVVNNPDGSWWLQAEGHGITTVRATIGDTLTWDPEARQFSAIPAAPAE